MVNLSPAVMMEIEKAFLAAGFLLRRPLFSAGQHRLRPFGYFRVQVAVWVRQRVLPRDHFILEPQFAMWCQ